MALVPVDISKIKLDAPMSDIAASKMRELYPDETTAGGFVPVDINAIKLDQAPVQPEAAQEPTKPGYAEDIAKTIAFKGIPEGLAASTLGGMALNIPRVVSDLTRWAAGKAYKGIYGEELPHYAGDNPIPTSSDVLKAVATKLPPSIRDKVGVTDEGLYEPKTIPGQFANTISQFAAGGKATGVPFNQSIPSAVVSEIAGQLTKGSDWEVPARFAGALIAPGGVTSSRRNGGEALKPAETVRENASNLFKLAEKQGGKVPATKTNMWTEQANKILPQTDEARAILGDNAATDLVARIQKVKDKPLTLTAAHEIDSGLGKLANKYIDPRTGKYLAEGSDILKIQDSLRKIVDDLPDEGFATLKQAKSEWGKSVRMSDLERINERALATDNPAKSLQTGYANLKKNKKLYNQYNKAEKSAITKAAKTGVLTGALRVGGSRLISGLVGATAGAAGGGPLGALGGALVGEAAAIPMRAAATKIQMNRANDALATVANRGQIPTKSALMQLLDQKVEPFRGVTIQPRIPVSVAR